MARNRKRAKERRARRPQPAVTRGGGEHQETASPAPLEHASPEAELAEAQLALGRPELAAEPPEEPADEAADEFVETDEGGELAPAADGAGRRPGEVERPPIGNRLVNFLQGSWRELQRVQWPDRRQVLQATGVVIGFVIVAGAFLGVADLIADKIVSLIIK